MRAGAALAAGAVACLLLASAASAAAQQRSPRGFVELTAATNVGMPATVTQDHQFTEFLETADVKSVVRQNRGARVGGRAGWWITRRVGIAAGMTVLHASGTVQGSYAFPSPFVFDMPVTTSGEAAVTRRSIDTEIDVMASLIDARGWQLTVGVGPDFSHVRQQLLADVLAAAYEFPFTSITLTHSSGQRQGTAVGIHVTTAVARHLGRHLDLAGTVDFRRAPVHLTTADGPATVDPGGATAGGGLRVRF